MVLREFQFTNMQRTWVSSEFNLLFIIRPCEDSLSASLWIPQTDSSPELSQDLSTPVLSPALLSPAARRKRWCLLAQSQKNIDCWFKNLAQGKMASNEKTKNSTWLKNLAPGKKAWNEKNKKSTWLENLESSSTTEEILSNPWWSVLMKQSHVWRDWRIYHCPWQPTPSAFNVAFGVVVCMLLTHNSLGCTITRDYVVPQPMWWWDRISDSIHTLLVLVCRSTYRIPSVLLVALMSVWRLFSSNEKQLADKIVKTAAAFAATHPYGPASTIPKYLEKIQQGSLMMPRFGRLMECSCLCEHHQERNQAYSDTLLG